MLSTMRLPISGEPPSFRDTPAVTEPLNIFLCEGAAAYNLASSIEHAAREAGLDANAEGVFHTSGNKVDPAVFVSKNDVIRRPDANHETCATSPGSGTYPRCRHRDRRRRPARPWPRSVQGFIAVPRSHGRVKASPSPGGIPGASLRLFEIQDHGARRRQTAP